MDLTIILSLIKLGLGVFQDERKDRYLKKYLALEKDYQDELNKGLDSWSDLALDRMRFEARQLAQLIVDDANGKK
jgi:hypothetical protein